MKTKKRVWILLLLMMGGIIILTTNCNKNKNEEPDPGKPASTLTTDKSTVNQFEVVTLTPTNISFNNTEYTGSIGGQDVTILMSGNKLLFLVPEILPGAQKLTTTIEGSTYTINFTISQPAVIQDPVTFLQGVINEFNFTIESIDIRIDTLVKYGLVNGTDEKLILQIIKDSLTYFNQQFMLLSADNQLKTARTLLVNMTDLNIAMDSLSPLVSEIYGQGFNPKSTSCDQEQRSWRMLCLMTKYNRLKGQINVTAKLNALLFLLTLPLPGWAKIPFNLINYSWTSIADQYFLLGFELGSRPYHPMEIIFSGPPSSFINFEPQSISLAIKVRNAKENPDEDDKYWEKEFSGNMKDQINSWNLDIWRFFSGKIRFRAFPILLQPNLLPESYDLLNAKITSNTNVFNIPIPSANNDLYLKFGTNEAGTQNFSFKMEYDDYNFSLMTVDFPAVLIGAEPYNITKDSGDGQTGQFGQPLPDPISAIVKDQEGNPFEGAIVKFTANNNGSVSQSEVTTGSNGIASVIWTLGTVDESQTMTVTAFKSDNITPLQGSPLTFTSSIGFHIGQIYGGGVIFYIDSTGNHGLIAAPSDMDTVIWGCYSTLIGGTSTAIGTGQSNTAAIVNGCSTPNIAARVCNDLVLNSYDDWFLPSKDELNMMQPLQNVIGGFINTFYWSSSEVDPQRAYVLFLSSGVWGTLVKNTTVQELSVRPVRAF